MLDTVSVAMATYNGGKFIRAQLLSILLNIDSNDELIISDDGSTDETVEIIKEFQRKYGFIKLYKNIHKKGPVGNFETAIENCTKDFIFLSDQDDVWYFNKKKKIISIFNANPNVQLVLHNAYIFNNSKKKVTGDLFSKLGYRKSIIGLIIKNPYIGCCMAFRKSLKVQILPFPDYSLIYIHDWWIAICAIKVGKTAYIQDKLILYRIHENNNIGFNKTDLFFKIKKRLNIIKCIIKERGRFH